MYGSYQEARPNIFILSSYSINVSENASGSSPFQPLLPPPANLPFLTKRPTPILHPQHPCLPSTRKGGRTLLLLVGRVFGEEEGDRLDCWTARWIWSLSRLGRRRAISTRMIWGRWRKRTSCASFLAVNEHRLDSHPLLYLISSLQISLPLPLLMPMVAHMHL
jgi:hypothetical protein